MASNHVPLLLEGTMKTRIKERQRERERERKPKEDRERGKEGIPHRHAAEKTSIPEYVKVISKCLNCFIATGLVTGPVEVCQEDR
jgi:hypothetical protein